MTVRVARSARMLRTAPVATQNALANAPCMHSTLGAGLAIREPTNVCSASGPGTPGNFHKTSACPEGWLRFAAKSIALADQLICAGEFAIVVAWRQAPLVRKAAWTTAPRS